jgi:hypothetical protein
MLSIEQEERIIKEMTEIQKGGFQSGAITNARIAQIAYEQSQEGRYPLSELPFMNWVRGFKRRHKDELDRGILNDRTFGRAVVTQSQLTSWTEKLIEKLEHK